jgi:hypothetical protein
MRFKGSAEAVLNMARSVGAENLLFVHLPQKEELTSGLNFMGRKGREFIREHGLTLVDGLKECGLEIADFHLRDGHPNARGYSKVEECVDRALKRTFGPL